MTKRSLEELALIKDAKRREVEKICDERNRELEELMKRDIKKIGVKEVIDFIGFDVSEYASRTNYRFEEGQIIQGNTQHLGFSVKVSEEQLVLLMTNLRYIDVELKIYRGKPVRDYYQKLSKAIQDEIIKDSENLPF